MVAAEEGQGLVIERLQPQRQPANAGAREGGEAARLGIGGIGLQRHLDLAVAGPEVLGHADDGLRPFGRHQRGRAAAQVDRDQAARAGQGAVALQVGQYGAGQHRLLLGLAAVAHHVEVAIGADAGAIGPVHIDRDRRGVGDAGTGRRPDRCPRRIAQNSAAFSFSKARARWLMRSFTAAVSSPKVLSYPSGAKIGS